MVVSKILFWVAAALLAYVYVGYPAVLALWARRKGRRSGPVPAAAEGPRVSIVLPTHNDASHIAAKIECLLSLHYPAELLEILVVSDGSTDGTDSIAATYTSRGVRLIQYPERRGKPHALNAGVAAAGGDLLIFTDARQPIDADAVRLLTRHFGDPAVGVVSGALIFRRHGASAIEEGMDLYMRYEFWLRERESEIDSMLGATGALYAIRRELWSPVPEEVLLDDMYTPMRIVLSGKRAILEPMARAYDEPAPDAGLEFRRKVRTLTGNFQLIRHLPDLLSPRRNRVWFQFGSHKLLRLVAPYLLILLMASSAALSSHPLYRFFFAAQSLFYILAVAGLFLPAHGALRRILAVPRAFVVMNGAAVLGAIYAAAGKWDVWVRE